MTAKQPFWKIVLDGAIRVLLGICALSFLFGGGLIRALTKTDRTLAELEGIGIAGICLILSVVFSHLRDNIRDPEDDGESDIESIQK